MHQTCSIEDAYDGRANVRRPNFLRVYTVENEMKVSSVIGLLCLLSVSQGWDLRTLRHNPCICACLFWLFFSRVVKVRLPSQLLRAPGLGRLFINLHSLNSTSGLSSAFPELIFRGVADIPTCSMQRPTTRIDVKTRPVTYIMHWSTDVVFRWPGNSPEVAMFLQPCLRRPRRLGLFKLDVFHE